MVASNADPASAKTTPPPPPFSGTVPFGRYVMNDDLLELNIWLNGLSSAVKLSCCSANPSHSYT